MNLDVPLDELIKSKTSKRSGSVAPGKRGGAKKVAKINGLRNNSRQAARRLTIQSASAATTSRSNAGGGTSKKVPSDPFSVPLDSLIASKSRPSAPQGQPNNVGGVSRRGRPQQQSTRATSLGGRMRGRRYFSGATASRSSLQNVDGSDLRVSRKVNVKQGVQQKQKARYSKGLAGHINRNKVISSAPGGVTNLSINRRIANSQGAQSRRAGTALSGRQRRQQNESNRGGGSALGGARSIALQNNRGRGNAPRTGGDLGSGTSRSMISHAIGDTLSYNTGLSGGAAAIYRQGNMGVSTSGCHVAPPVYDKSVVTGSGITTQGLDNNDNVSAVFSESDRSMFSKIKIMAQLDKIASPPANGPSVAANQRHYINAPGGNMSVGNGGVMPRYRTLSDRFLS